MDNLKEQFGTSITISPDFEWEWVYIPHFYHTPFTLRLSFGNLLVLSLTGVTSLKVVRLLSPSISRYCLQVDQRKHGGAPDGSRH